ncbi:MAG: hypothetical protein M1814_001823 [Vezdaea aestivalis]|nr:MAG: hypothetical protein M1814_001823 [Vezdaea aestivalis]
MNFLSSAIFFLSVHALPSHSPSLQPVLTCRDGLPSPSWAGWANITDPFTYNNIIQFCSIETKALSSLANPSSAWAPRVRQTNETDMNKIATDFCLQRCFTSFDGKPSELQSKWLRNQDTVQEDGLEVNVFLGAKEAGEPKPGHRFVTFFSSDSPDREGCDQKVGDLCKYKESWPELSSEKDTNPNRTNTPVSDNPDLSPTSVETPQIRGTDSAVSQPQDQNNFIEVEPNRTSDLKLRSAKSSPEADPERSRLSNPPAADQGGERGPGISGNIGTYPHSHTEQTILSVGCILLGVTLSIVGSALSWQDKGLGGHRQNNGRDFV